jgi:hypothetical protein
MIPGSKNKNSTKSVIIGIVFMVLIFIGVGVFILNLNARTKEPNEFNLTSDSLVIEGMYGETYALSDLTGIEMLGAVPEITYKRDGAGIGTVRKGVFTLTGYGDCNVYLFTEGKCIHIVANEGKDVFINFENEADTDALYDQLSEVIPEAA